jgi:hypothetical protein
VKGRSFDAQVERAKRLRVRLDGPRAAAWLLFRPTARRSLHSAGSIDFNFRGPRGEGRPAEKEPAYFLYAMAFLKLRPRRWNVEVRENVDGGRTYRVTWRGWHTNGAKWASEAAAARREANRRARNARKKAERRWAGR